MDSFQRLLVSIVRFHSGEPDFPVWCFVISFVLWTKVSFGTSLTLMQRGYFFLVQRIFSSHPLLLTPTRRPEDTKFPQEPIIGSWFPL